MFGSSSKYTLRFAHALSTIGIVSAFFLAGAGCKREQVAIPTERPPAPVSVASVVVQDAPVYLDEVGKCTTPEMVTIQAQVGGRITKLHFNEGADLHVNDPLFTIDPRPFQAALDQTQAALIQSKATREYAKSEFARVEKLVGTKAISQQDYDLRKTAVDVAEAQVQSSTAAVDMAKLNLEYCSIRSPIEGRAGQRLADKGNVVMANSGNALLTIQRLDPIYAEFTINENDLSAVQRNMADGTLQVEVRLPDETDKPRTGKLSFLDNAVQEGTIKLRATITNADHHFWPGRFVRIRLILSVQKDATLIPAGAPQPSSKGSFVYVVRADSTAELRPVTLGQRQGDLVVINQGLKAGERVITVGQIAVMPGGKVQVVDSNATTQPTTNQASNAGEK